jgi:uncharacterized phage infection (PIP) family protein YhgE
MIELNGIGNSPQSPSQRSERSRAQPSHAANLVSSDALEISEEAKRAASNFNTVVQNATESELRNEMVASAKQRVQEGSHRLQAVVSQVASRLSPFL